jgi:bifunctional DNA-binding transcriptional regulator/antitoxin component of YhaV-PrlF toxin-antitoxin module
MAKTKVVKLLRNGQITIPAEFRDALHLDDEEALAMTLMDGKLEMQVLRPATNQSGSQWAKDLYDLFAPVRESLEGYSDQEINDAIDEALKAVRAEQT